jgi:hypothetical protein
MDIQARAISIFTAVAPYVTSTLGVPRTLHVSYTWAY